MILLASDSWKGTFTSQEVNQALARGIEKAGQKATRLSVADGGEGTIDTLLQTKPGKRITHTVSDPLSRKVEAYYGLFDDGTACIEVAQATGLWRLREDEYNPFIASSKGTGELIVHALENGASHV